MCGCGWGGTSCPYCVVCDIRGHRDLRKERGGGRRGGRGRGGQREDEIRRREVRGAGLSWFLWTLSTMFIYWALTGSWTIVCLSAFNSRFSDTVFVAFLRTDVETAISEVHSSLTL